MDFHFKHPSQFKTLSTTAFNIIRNLNHFFHTCVAPPYLVIGGDIMNMFGLEVLNYFTLAY